MIGLALRMRPRIQDVRLHENVDPSVAVIVAKRRFHTAVNQGQAALRRLLLEGAIMLIYLEEIGGAHATYIKIEIPVVVDIDKNRALVPDLPGFAG